MFGRRPQNPLGNSSVGPPRDARATELCGPRPVARCPGGPRLAIRAPHWSAAPFKTVRILSKALRFCNHFGHKRNSDVISKSLAIAMTADNAPDKLKLEFEYGELTPVMRQMLLDYMELISSLSISVKGNNKELLLQQSTVFKSLESLCLGYPNYNYTKYKNIASACEAMLSKHAHNLKYLEVHDLRENLNVPALPVIDSLVLSNVVDEEAAQGLFEQSRNTITSFTIIKTNLKLFNLNVPALPVIDCLVLRNLEDEEAAQFLYEQSRNTITSFTISMANLKLSNLAAFKEECLFPFITLILLQTSKMQYILYMFFVQLFSFFFYISYLLVGLRQQYAVKVHIWARKQICTILDSEHKAPGPGKYS